MTAKKTAVVLMATYNDWESILELLPRIDGQLQGMDISGTIVIIDDGSTDIGARNDVSGLDFKAIASVECVNLFRNHGNQRANAIGVAYCAEKHPADYLIVMDSDQEDDPAYIPDLIGKCDENDGTKIIFAERTTRTEGPLFGFFYGAYKRLYHVLTGMPISIGNYSVVPSSLVRRLANVAELWSHFPASIMRARLPFARIPSARAARTQGKSKMNMVSLILHAISGFSVHAEMVGVRILIMAVVASLAVLGLVVVAVLLKVFTGIPLLGWTSQIVGLLLIMLFQLFITVLIMVFLVVSARQQVPMIPAAVYERFIDRVDSLYPASRDSST